MFWELLKENLKVGLMVILLLALVIFGGVGTVVLAAWLIVNIPVLGWFLALVWIMFLAIILMTIEDYYNLQKTQKHNERMKKWADEHNKTYTPWL